MTKIVLTGFKFKPVHIKKNVVKHRSNRVSNQLYCVCVKEDDEFKAHVNITSELEFPDTLVIPFTEDSYNLKGKTDIFTKVPDKNGKYTRICRTSVHAEQFPNLDELYTPFREMYVYSGYIVIVDGHHEFEVSNFVDHYVNANYLVPNIKLNIVKNEEQCK